MGAKEFFGQSLVNEEDEEQDEPESTPVKSETKPAKPQSEDTKVSTQTPNADSPSVKKPKSIIKSPKANTEPQQVDNSELPIRVMSPEEVAAMKAGKPSVKFDSSVKAAAKKAAKEPKEEPEEEPKKMSLFKQRMLQK